MVVEIKYGIGDRVKFKFAQKEIEYAPCPCCGGRGTIDGVDGNEYECSECDGSGKVEIKSIKVMHDYYNTIDDIKVVWSRDKKDAKVYYKMNGWNWSYTWIDEEAIEELLTS